MSPGRFLPLSILAAALCGCGTAPPPMDTVEHVDLERFMGRWYVIANIPTFIEKDAYNAVETYRLNDDGTVATTYAYRKGGFDGERREYHPRGFIRDDSNALWGMRFIWPIKADYRIVYLDADYSTTIIARRKRDYVWIMAREPGIPDHEYRELKSFVGELGYDAGELRKVPQQW